jgi:hypothetical protein
VSVIFEPAFELTFEPTTLPAHNLKVSPAIEENPNFERHSTPGGSVDAYFEHMDTYSEIWTHILEIKKLTPDPKAAGAMGLPCESGLEARARSKPLRDGGCYLQTGPIHAHMEAKEAGGR